MNEPIEVRNAQWDAFLERWPLDKLPGMSLREYSEAGNQDCFVYCLESKTEALGSIWGGSAFKFGIYSRKQAGDAKRDGERYYGENYAWYAKYGDTPEAAFGQVINKIVQIANAARSGNLEAIDDVDLGQVVKWKLAFLYQDREHPSILPVLKLEYLQAAASSKQKKVSTLQRKLMEQRGSQGVLEYGDAVWADVQDKMSTELTAEEAKAFLDQSERFTPIKPATQKIAGYSTSTGQQLALLLENRKTTIYLGAGPWLAQVRAQLQEVESYSEARPRNSNIAANAPALAVGNAMVKVVVPNMDVFLTLCDAYDGADEAGDIERSAVPIQHMNQSPPLNQILFGPPGTGKTYETINAALEILAPEFLAANRDDRAAVKRHFDAQVAAGHVRFVTFHQSFSYEDFVEGIRAESNEDGQLTYSVVDGVFKSLCEAAGARVTKQAEAPLDLKGRRVWKMSLGNTLGSDAYIFDECIDKGYALHGYGGLTDFSGSKTRDDIIKRFQDAGTPIAEDAYAVTAVSTFVLKMKMGDLIVVTDGNTKFRAIGEITGDYQRLGRDEQGDNYGQCRAVRWLRVYKPSLPLDQLMANQFSQMTLYELRPGAIDMEKLAALLQTKPASAQAAGGAPYQVGEVFGRAYSVTKASPDVLELKKPNGNELAFSMRMLNALADYVRRGELTIDDIKEKRVFDKVSESSLEPFLVNGYNNILPALVERLVVGQPDSSAGDVVTPLRNAKVLIIDEINRGNVSRVLGELITLIEPSKRAGNAEALEVTLPYSKERFSVPANLYLIGTMNTADRSLAGLDLALRRRFSFREMPPRPDLLDTVEISGVNVGALLRVMNERIELLLDRDHCIGHAYFMALADAPTIDALGDVFRSKLIPLLQEYFFEDWQRIQWVLNDHRKVAAHRFIQKPASNVAQLFGEGVSVSDQNQRWSINEAAFSLAEAYAGVIEHPGVVGE
ncbi:conserved hypothetical protein [Cupriavidus taiwanensis]|uniref:ATPase dynein-related AAA domain-containing protein n=1 Tax=Cupriavidus taiwanensis TaxID=164546 RepID=A0A375EDN6_9BURK|nr:AAA family ATPase [Cupriavidus taiwanensis]SOZ73761.1 conserved hypothetical protein [Cupriavidus taiwanensis]SOZ74124.1 conserved hypothetical protein [Cupriavidus taiwanensis]SOZ75442.1 conserved hypothetical protein [Cupriavidus taiwanensis]SPA12965.1 conserved hypothetical protein [Cupriavidus taiwanensis]